MSNGQGREEKREQRGNRVEGRWRREKRERKERGGKRDMKGWKSEGKSACSSRKKSRVFMTRNVKKASTN